MLHLLHTHTPVICGVITYPPFSGARIDGSRATSSSNTVVVRPFDYRDERTRQTSLCPLVTRIHLYNRGGNSNPYLDSRLRPLNPADADIDALLAFLQALEGEDYADTAPATFPQ